MKELGYDFEVPFWTALYAPKNTPKAVIDKIAATSQKAMSDAGLVKRLSDIGTEFSQFHGGRARHAQPGAVQALPGHRAE